MYNGQNSIIETAKVNQTENDGSKASASGKHLSIIVTKISISDGRKVAGNNFSCNSSSLLLCVPPTHYTAPLIHVLPAGT